MKALLSFAFTLGWLGSGMAAPYLVYSGSGTGVIASTSGNTSTSTAFYLVTDMADTSSFTVLQCDEKSHFYEIDSRPTANPTDEERNGNFLSGFTASDQKSGVAVFAYSTDRTDTDGNTLVTHAYGTGPLILKNFTLVKARTKPLIVNGLVVGDDINPIFGYTFDPSSPITTGTTSIPESLKGSYYNYFITSGGGMTSANTKGTFTYTLDSGLTALANIGGSFRSHGTVSAILPITVSDPAKATTIYTSWLGNFAVLNGFSSPSVGGSSSSSGFSAILGTDSSEITLTLSNGVPDKDSLIITSSANGLVSGTIIYSSSQVSFTGAVLNVNGLNIGGSLPPATKLVGNISISGSTYTTPGSGGTLSTGGTISLVSH